MAVFILYKIFIINVYNNSILFMKNNSKYTFFKICLFEKKKKKKNKKKKKKKKKKK